MPSAQAGTANPRTGLLRQEIEIFDRAERHLSGERRVLAQVFEGMTCAQLAVVIVMATRLAHEPYRGARCVAPLDCRLEQVLHWGASRTAAVSRLIANATDTTNHLRRGWVRLDQASQPHNEIIDGARRWEFVWCPGAIEDFVPREHCTLLLEQQREHGTLPYVVSDTFRRLPKPPCGSDRCAPARPATAVRISFPCSPGASARRSAFSMRNS